MSNIVDPPGRFTTLKRKWNGWDMEYQAEI